MKKIIAILLLAASLSLMFACNEDEEPNTPPIEGEQIPGPENNWGDFDGDGTTDSLQGPGMGPIAPIT